MPANTKPIFVVVPNLAGVTWTNADAALTKKTIFTAAANGSLLQALAMSSSDTAAVVFNLYLNDGGTDFLIGSFSLAAGTGTAGAASGNPLANSTAWPFVGEHGELPLDTGWVVKLENVTQVTAAKTVTVVAIGGDY